MKALPPNERDVCRGTVRVAKDHIPKYATSDWKPECSALNKQVRNVCEGQPGDEAKKIFDQCISKHGGVLAWMSSWGGRASNPQFATHTPDAHESAHSAKQTAKLKKLTDWRKQEVATEAKAAATVSTLDTHRTHMDAQLNYRQQDSVAGGSHGLHPGLDRRRQDVLQVMMKRGGSMTERATAERASPQTRRGRGTSRGPSQVRVCPL